MNLNNCERQIMNKILAGDHPALKILRDQFAVISVQERTFTGSGFYTYFRVSSNTPRMETPADMTISDVNAQVQKFRAPVGCILNIKNGIIDSLECHSWGTDKINREFKIEKLYYVALEDDFSQKTEDPTQRNLSFLEG